VEKNIYKFVFKYSLRQQFFVLGITLISLPFYYASLDIPKKIVNQALIGGGNNFPKTLDLFGVPIAAFDQIPLLAVLSGLFLTLVIVNGIFKYVINVYKGLLGERMLRRLRYQLFGRILRFPLPHFRKVSQGELIPMITAEVEPLGGFVGDALALPVYQGGLLITAVIFIFAQDLVLGLAAISLYPLQGYLIPRLQRRVNELGKQRVREVRRLAGRISETASGATEIHAHDTSRYELADFSHRLGRIFDIRYQIYRKKFFIKFLNNFLNHLTPFFFYSVGGYLVIGGNVSLGALVAILSAYKDLPGPWRELLRYYQTKEDSRIKYEQVVSQFAPPGLKDEALLDAEIEPEPERLEGDVSAIRLGYAEDDVKLVDGVTFRFGLDECVAVVGAGSSGKETLAQLLARLIDPTSGRLTIGSTDVLSLPEAVTGRRISYVGANAYLFSGSIDENLLHGLKHRPRRAIEDDPARRLEREEAALAGNSTDDLDADWIDCEALGAEAREDVTRACIRVLNIAEMADDVYVFGLRGTIDTERWPAVTERILEARRMLLRRLTEGDLADYVEPFDKDRYNNNATLAENLLFGNPVGDTFDIDRLADNEYVISVLRHCDLIDALLDRGYEVASTMVELFSDLPAEHEFFEQYSFINADDLPEFRDLIGQVDRDRLDTLKENERRRLISLPFKLIPSRHRLGILDDSMRAHLLDARHMFAANLPEDMRDAVEFFDSDRYNAAASVQDNILFGKLVFGQAQSETRVGAAISEVIDALDLRDTVIAAGLNFAVGVGGGRLDIGQRQKLALARAILKRPDLLIVNEATAVLDGATHNRILDNLLAEFAGRGLVWVLNRPSQAGRFGRVLVMRGGRLVAEGRFDDLAERNDHLAELVAAE